MTTWEIVERGEELYQTKIRVHVETEANQGKFVVLDILTGDFVLHTDSPQIAANRLRERHPQAAIFGLQIGVDAPYIVGLPKTPPPPESSNTEVRSYQDYERELAKLVSGLSPLTGIRFGLSCVTTLTRLAQENIDAEVSAEHKILYGAIFEEIEHNSGQGKLLSTERASELGTALLNNIMGTDTDTWIDVDSLVSNWVLGLHHLLQYCQKPDHTHLEAVATEVINTLDYLHDPGLPAMFTLAPFHDEWERQQRAVTEE
ncbi:MAG: hypothetical protein NTX57_19255 [Armatimonadetes bacterium]|nr:hypothetical protein [Armatimonadota bacterium]